MDKNCVSCLHNIREEVGGNTVCHCQVTGAYIGIELEKSHWCRHWEEDETDVVKENYRNAQR